MTREKPYVLLVDDNEATCTLVRAILQRDFTVEIARDGMEAIDTLRTKQYAAVLLDLWMPQLDGYAVLEFLKSTKPAVLSRVLILTASLAASELERVRAYNVCGIIAKPFDVEALLGAVKDCVGDDGGYPPLFVSGGMILLLADWLRRL
ncbi:MAG TPA: response regulator [Thermoanaerobaculia bacterium]|nr:response regulator [Thermoanaerobaculia bacterium]